MVGMKGPKSSAVGRRRVGSAEEAAFLDLLRTADLLGRGIAAVLKAEALSPTQYNMLRILRGAPEGLSCGEIGDRMITRDPDITRLLDRLEKRRLISRSRETRDRRTVVTKITPAGLALLGRLDEPVRQAHRRQLGHMGAGKLRKLMRLLEEARRDNAR
jgi:DNA-binding MarR family transcriptional regulator